MATSGAWLTQNLLAVGKLSGSIPRALRELSDGLRWLRTAADASAAAPKAETRRARLLKVAEVRMAMGMVL